MTAVNKVATERPRGLGLGRLLSGAAGALAFSGGLVLIGVMLMTVASVVGRALFSSPILGDFELVERGCAITVFAFLPYCHLKGGHVTVDIFTSRWPAVPRRVVAVANEGIFAAVAAVLTWRLALGGIDLKTYHETSMMLQIPTWWMFLVVVPAAGLLCLVCLYRLCRALAGDEC